MTHTYKAQHSGGKERKIKKFKFNLGYSQSLRPALVTLWDLVSKLKKKKDS